MAIADKFKYFLKNHLSFSKAWRYPRYVRATEIDDKLIIIQNLLNLSGDSIGEKFSEIIFESTGDKRILNRIKKTSFLLKPTHKNDHLATPFVEVEPDKRGENLLRLTVCYSLKNNPGENCSLLIQDEKCNSLLSMQCFLSDNISPSELYEKRYVSIPENVKSVRVNISSADGAPTHLPEAMVLEHVVLPNLVEMEQKEIDRIKKDISAKGKPTRHLLSHKQLPGQNNTGLQILDDNLIVSNKLIYLSGVFFREKLIENSYEVGKKTKILFNTGKGSLLLKPIQEKDHLVTQFVRIKIDERGENLLRLTICYSGKNYPNESCTLVVQDEKFNSILTVPCYVPDESQQPTEYAMEYATIPQGTNSVRLSICSKNASSTYLPETIILELAVVAGNKVPEATKQTLNSIIDGYRKNAKLSTFLDLDETPFYSLSDYEKLVESFSKEELQEFFKDDPWFVNYILNIWEYVHGETELTTYPWTICIPISDNCNATCPFCNSWIRGTRQLDLNESENFLPLLQHAKLLGLAGHGEPLMHPEFEIIARRINEAVDPRCVIYLVTNGILLERHLDLLIDINVRTFNISINASTPETYEKIMGVKKNVFDRIISCIERLVAIRETSEKKDFPTVNISMVVINQNIHEAASFVELGNQLKVNNIHLNTLMPQSRPVDGLNYHTLPAYLNPRFSEYQQEAIKAISSSGSNVIGSPEAWATPIFPLQLEELFKKHPPHIHSTHEVRKNRARYLEEIPKITKGHPLPKTDRPPEIEETMDENPYGRTPRYKCRDIYYNLNLNDFLFQLNPCCYMWDIPGFEPIIYNGGYDFFEAWNSPAMVELRSRLKDGPLYSYCKRCPSQNR
jgi:MoaA/NifB/PqqE/SkfB family radical SAM enzyme